MPLSTDVWVWVPPKADSETRILAQVVYWEVIQEAPLGVRKRREKRRKSIKVALLSRSPPCAIGLNPAGTTAILSRTCLRVVLP